MNNFLFDHFSVKSGGEKLFHKTRKGFCINRQKNGKIDDIFFVLSQLGKYLCL